MLKLLHIGNGRSAMKAEGPFYERLRKLVEVTVIPDGSDIPDARRAEMIRECDILMLCWGSMPIPEEVASAPGNLKYVINLTGELRRWVPLSIVEAGIPVTNWGDAPADGIAEGAMVLLLAVMKNLRDHIETVAEGGWEIPSKGTKATLKGCDVGIYGMGVIGRRFVELIRPFGSNLRVYDPYVAEFPEGCLRVDSLKELFSSSKIIVIHAGLSDETRHTVGRELLAMLPDGGIIINTARGGIIVQDELFAELESGRLRAGLDVLDGKLGDVLEEDHPARLWRNVIFTGHHVSGASWGGDEDENRAMHQIFLDNIQRFIEGRELRFIMDRDRYLRST